MTAPDYLLPVMQHHPDVDTYIAAFPGPVQERLRAIRALIATLVPDAEEVISYGLPAYRRHGRPMVYFGGFARHTGFYATPDGHEAFESRLSAYKRGRGSVQFPHSRPLPLDLIGDIIRYRAETPPGR